MNEWELIGKVIMAGILSGIIGFERERHGREAGLRTMILVGMGTTVILVSSFQVYYIFSNIQNPMIRLDPARIAYGVVTGIGFLGAGVIIKEQKRVRGLTTAACLWFVTSISLAVGVGLYFLSIFLTLISVIVLYFLKIFEKKIPIDKYSILTVKIRDDIELKNNIIRLIEKENLKILSLQMERSKEEKTVELIFTIRYRKPKNPEIVFEKISEFEGIKNIKLE
jgi:putative Mg2+ transporter-C (MgtC) family protein